MHKLTIFLIFLLPGLAMAGPITYQGQLQDGSGPVTDTPDMVFRLYDSLVDGDPVGDDQSLSGVPVTDGLFQVELDFGANAFDGGERWLEIEVGGQLLQPRQPITAAPMAIHALNVSDAADTLAELDCAAGEIAKWDGAAWACAADEDTIYSAGDGLVLSDTTFSLDAEHTDGLYWRRGGNAGTDPGTDFIGTTDAAPVVFRADGEQALILHGVQTTAEGWHAAGNFIAGHPGNAVLGDAVGATIGGGGVNDAESEQFNTISAHFGVVAGGTGNRAHANWATVSGGLANEAGGQQAAIGGGSQNVASGQLVAIGGGGRNEADGDVAIIAGGMDNQAEGFASVISGGTQNVAGETHAAVLGGRNNIASGEWSTIVGGLDNRATGQTSLAAGHRARAVHDGTFVWADSGFGEVESTANDQFLIQADGGVGINTTSPSATIQVLGEAAFGVQSNVADGIFSFASGGLINSGTGDEFPNLALGDVSFIGGGALNEAAGVASALLGGTANQAGGYASAIVGGQDHNISGDYAFIAGGINHEASERGFIGGGVNNQTSAWDAAVVGGSTNNATSSNVFIGGGSNNTASGLSSFIAGGSGNTITQFGARGFIAGGEGNTVEGRNGFAGGRGATVNHDGTFIWADDHEEAFESTAANQFLIRAGGGVGINTNAPARMLHMRGNLSQTPTMLFESEDAPEDQRVAALFMNATSGHMSIGRMTDDGTSLVTTHLQVRADDGYVGIGRTGGSIDHPLHMASGAHVTAGGAWTNASDVNAKTGFVPVDAGEVLARLVDLPLSYWSYKAEPGIRRLGPMAQDFQAAFKLGDEDTSIATVDATGVALAGIQALQSELADERRRNDALEDRLAALESLLLDDRAVADRQ